MLVRVPKNTLVVKGTAVTFECSSNVTRSIIQWHNKLCINGNVAECSSSDRIYNGFGSNYQPGFNVTAVNNDTHIKRNLDIISTQLTDAGVYACVEFSGQYVTDTSSAQLIVLGMKTVYRFKYAVSNWTL